jgi:hypothetical protein
MIEKKYFVWAGKAAVWLLLLYLASLAKMGNYFFIVSALYWIFTNLGHLKPGEKSAYSIFNPNNEKLLGTFTGNEWLRPMGNATAAEIPSDPEHEKDLAKLADSYYQHQSKMGNKPCYCGSNLKYKKCCLIEREKQKPL